MKFALLLIAVPLLAQQTHLRDTAYFTFGNPPARANCQLVVQSPNTLATSFFFSTSINYNVVNGIVDLWLTPSSSSYQVTGNCYSVSGGRLNNSPVNMCWTVPTTTPTTMPLVIQACTGNSVGTNGSPIDTGITALTGDGTAGPGTGVLPFTLATVNGSPGPCGDATHVSQLTVNAKGLVTACTPVSITGTGLNQLTGDAVAGPGTGSQVITFTTVNGSPGSCGDATHVSQFTVNAKGLVTSCTPVLITGTGLNQLTGDGTAGPGTGSQSLTLASVNGSPGACGDATHVGQLTVNAKGLVTACTPITITGSGLSQLTGDGTAGPGTGSQAFTLATVNGSPGPCGDATHVSQLTVNAKGLVTACTPVSITGSGLDQLTGDGTAGPGVGSQAFTLATVNGAPGSCGDATHVSQITVNGKGLMTACTAVAITGVSAAPYNAVSDSSTITWNLGSAAITNGIVTLNHTTATRALNLTNLANGGNYTLVIKQDSTGGAALTLGTGCTWVVANGGAGSITLTSAASARDVLTFTYDGTNCNAALIPNFN